MVATIVSPKILTIFVAVTKAMFVAVPMKLFVAASNSPVAKAFVRADATFVAPLNVINPLVNEPATLVAFARVINPFVSDPAMFVAVPMKLLVADRTMLLSVLQ